MKRWGSILLTVLLLCAVMLAGVTASTTLKGTTVETYMSLPAVIYSVSSAAALVLTLMVIIALIALISFVSKQQNVGFLFLCASTVLYLVFLIAFCSEKQNYVLFNTLSAMLKEAGVKSVKKRDVSILVRPDFLAYAVLGIQAAACIVAFPSAKSRQQHNTLVRELEPYAFIAPFLILFITFFLIPTIYGIYAAFTKWNIFDMPEFVGLANFRTLFFEKGNTYYKQVRNGLWNTVKFVIYSVPGCIIVPLLLALALQVKIKGNKFFQGLFYLPALMSASSVMLAWDYFFRKSYGMMNNLFGSTANWFAPPHTWIMIVIITIWWCTGGTMIIYQSALAGIPQDHYEAASIDGANAWQRFWHITIPGMRYPLSYTLTTTVVAQFNIYAQPDILLGYDNQETNAVLLMYIRDTAFKQQVAGMASAMALILGICIALATAFQVRVMRDNG